MTILMVTMLSMGNISCSKDNNEEETTMIPSGTYVEENGYPEELYTMVVNGNNKIQRGTAGSIAMDVTLEPSYDIDPPKKDEIVISGGTNRVYNSPDTVELTCTLNKEYDSNTEVYYEFGYASDMTALLLEKKDDIG